MLAEVGPRGKVLAGGQSLVPLLNMRLAAPAHLVDVNWLAELDEVATDAAAVRVGARARQARVEHDPDAAEADFFVGARSVMAVNARISISAVVAGGSGGSP